MQHNHGQDGLTHRRALGFKNEKRKVAIIAQSETVAGGHANIIEERTGFETIWATSGIHAMRLLRDNPPDAFIVTSDLPRTEDRGALCSALTFYGDGPVPVVLVVTKAGDVSAAARCLDQGAPDYISDPLDPTELAIRLRAHKDEIMALGFSPDSQWLATGGADKVVKVWSTRG